MSLERACLVTIAFSNNSLSIRVMSAIERSLALKDLLSRSVSVSISFLNAVTISSELSQLFHLDAVNSSGGIAVPILMEALGVTTVQIYCDPTGDFPHNPEPLKENLTVLSEKVVEEKAEPVVEEKAKDESKSKGLFSRIKNIFKRK